MPNTASPANPTPAEGGPLRPRAYRHRLGRRATAVAAGALLVVGMAYAAPAYAAFTGQKLAGSNFEIDTNANLTVDGASPSIDWLTAGSGSGMRPNVVLKGDKPTGAADDSFGQGSSENDPVPTVTDGSIPPNKSDLKSFGVYQERTGTGNFLHLFWARVQDPNGTTNMDFEFNKSQTLSANGVTPLRTANDLLITYDLANGGTVATLSLRTWTGTATAGSWSAASALTGSAIGSVNTTTIAANASGVLGSLSPRTFGEASIDLATVFGSGCSSFGSAYLKSRSSDSFTSALKDFIAPAPVNVTNCGGITIHKVTQNGDGTFGYTTTGALTPATFSLGNGGTQAYTAVPAGSYSVTESTLPAGWNLADLTCTTSGSGTSASTSTTTATITLGAGGSVDCIYTNHFTSSPTIATVLSSQPSGHVTIGASVHDTAALTGASTAPAATGTVTYTAYSDATCTTANARDAGTVTVAGGAIPDSNALVFNTAGTFYWRAAYSGDANNNPATSACTSEIVIVDRNNPTLATAQDLIPNDTATLTNLTALAGGTVTFALYAPTDATCAGTAAYASAPVALTGPTGATASTSNTIFHATTAGTWRWVVTYSGDANNAGATSACGAEQFTIING